MSATTYYVPLHISQLSVKTNLPYGPACPRANNPPGVVGYMIVFASLEDLHQEYPEAEYFEMRPKTEEEEAK